MGERTSYRPGTFCWADLGTVDPEGAKAFYTALFGWDVADTPMDAANAYSTFRLDGHDVCAVYGRDPAQGPPAWLSYVSVDDADATATRAEEVGGTVVQPAFDVLDSGRMALLKDPTGAVFAVWQPRGSIGATIVNVPAAICLNQLNTSDPARASAFYRDLFGWRIEQVSGDEPPYWGIYNGPGLNGGMMLLPEQAASAPSHWLVYFAAADIAVSAARIAELGGTVVIPPMAVQGGHICVAFDPQGAAFALFAGNLDP